MLRMCQMSGHLASNPEQKQVRGSDIVEARLAVSQGRDKPTMWFTITAWGQYQREALLRLGKGDRVVVAGRLGLDEYTTRDGVPKQALKVSVDAIEAPRKDQGQGQGQGFERRVTQAARNAYVRDDEIPF